MRFVWCWIIAATLLAGAFGCSGDDDGAGDGGSPSSSGSAGDRDGDGIPDSRDDDDDGDGISDDEDDDDRDGTGGGAGAGGGHGPNNPFGVPSFPGAGTSDAGDPLPGGMLCDSVPGEDLPIPNGGNAICFRDRNDPNAGIAATLEQVLECVEETDTVHIRLTFHPWFVDNTYGVNSIGWPPRRGHRWTDLTKSDHAEIILKDGAGNVVLQFKLDYVSEDPSKPSGYGSLGVTGGDGSVAVGDPSAIVKWSTSIDRNLNERGYGAYVPDSPATDRHFSPNPDAPEWDFRVVYEAWIDLGIFEDGGFGGATIEYVHASPAKAENDTIETTPGDCPPPPDKDCPNDDPDADCGSAGSGGSGGAGGGGEPCGGSDPDADCGGSGGTGGMGGSSGKGGAGNGGEPQDPCSDNDPDTVCDDGGRGGNGGDPSYCMAHPNDPACHVD